MRPLRFALVSLLALAMTACGATLTRGPEGWREPWMRYAIVPLDNGDLLPAGWTLDDFTPTEKGFRRKELPQYGVLDFGARHTADDAVLDLASVRMASEDRGVHVDTMADQWIERLVHHPNAGDTEVDRFSRAIPRLAQTATMQGRLETHILTFLEAYDTQVERRESFTVPGGEGVETVLSLGVHGAPIERELCLVVIRPTEGDKLIVVAYANRRSAFETDLPEALSFAHRVHF